MVDQLHSTFDRWRALSLSALLLISQYVMRYNSPLVLRSAPNNTNTPSGRKRGIMYGWVLLLLDDWIDTIHRSFQGQPFFLPTSNAGANDVLVTMQPEWAPLHKPIWAAGDLPLDYCLMDSTLLGIGCAVLPPGTVWVSLMNTGNCPPVPAPHYHLRKEC